ncbi:glycosyltransferase [Acetobacter oeni]|uniref:Glycosyltransferase subfamily 4-like N-terminal domain-containing protein n=1 Tax=Acetobacter oeni TaxID=304077 RepID=A0A511XL04_9PROT|nr:glycosyltransferase [Acetobacter oeni]MBB3883220.1 glycosyltransferase involved in cell wall biosynthesis [Acetobacter oeni]NHO19286.1 glycosyltransferase [Acetobacter oeni]GEN63631.1 hypothetical protein AOE01nite_18550 [Acetobacter oeni]
MRVTGFVDAAERYRITGWARAESDAAPVRLQVLDRGVVLGEVVADRSRPDLGVMCGFSFDIPGGLSPSERHVIEVRSVSGGEALGHTPWVIDVDGEAAARDALSGHLDIVTWDRIAGWAREGQSDDAPVALQILDNGAVLARIVANGRRPDVAQAGFGTGQCGFDMMLPVPLSPLTRHVIEVRREADGALLPGSPAVLEVADSFDPALEEALERAVTSLRSVEDQERVLSFLLTQADRVARQRADRLSGRSDRERERRLRLAGLPDGAPVMAKRALVIDSRLPAVARDAGSCAVLSHMRVLLSLGYAVSFAAADEMDRDGVDAEALRAEGVTVFRAPFDASVEDVLRRQEGSFDLVYLHRESVATRYLALARQLQPGARMVYSVADLHYLRLQRQGEVQERPELLAQARRVRLAECTAAWSADVVLTHSSVEAEILRRAVPEADVRCVPWAVETAAVVPGFEDRRGVVFFGDYSHAPNVDAVRWLVEEIMPLVWCEAPWIECVLAGSGMPDTLRGLTGERVRVPGHVPDLAGLLGQVRVGVAPLRFGAGVKGKVLECLAAGVPCVMTPVAAEGLNLSGELAELVGQDAAAVARLIVRVHEERGMCEAAARAGLQFVREKYSAAVVVTALADAVARRSVGAA